MSLAGQISLLATRIATEVKSKAPIASPTFTGDPKSVTPSAGDNDTSIATTAFVQGEKLITERSVTATTDTIVIGDANNSVGCSNASTITVTVPPNSSVAFPVGTIIELLQVGAGKVTVSPGSGVTINAAGSLLSTRAQWSALSLRKRATNTWVLVGDSAA